VTVDCHTLHCVTVTLTVTLTVTVNLTATVIMTVTLTVIVTVTMTVTVIVTVTSLTITSPFLPTSHCHISFHPISPPYPYLYPFLSYDPSMT